MALKKMMMSFAVLFLTTTVGITSDIEAMSQRELLEHHKKTVALFQKDIYRLQSKCDTTQGKLEEFYKSAEHFFGLPENDLQQKLIDRFSALQPQEQTWWGALTNLFGAHDAIQEFDAATKEMMVPRIAKKVGKVVRPYAQTDYYKASMDYYVALQLSGIIGALPGLYRDNPAENLEASLHKKVFDAILSYADENGIAFETLEGVDRAYYAELFTQTLADLSEKGVDAVEKELFEPSCASLIPPAPPPPSVLMMAKQAKTTPAAKKQADTELRTDARKSAALLEELAQRLQARVSKNQGNIEETIQAQKSKMTPDTQNFFAKTSLRKRRLSTSEENLVEEKAPCVAFDDFIQKARVWGGVCSFADDYWSSDDE